MSAAFKPRRQIIAELKAQKEADQERLQKQTLVHQKLTNYYQAIEGQWNRLKDFTLPMVHRLLKELSWGYFFLQTQCYSGWKGILKATLLHQATWRATRDLTSACSHTLGKLTRQCRFTILTIGWKGRYIGLGLGILAGISGNCYTLLHRFPNQPLTPYIRNVNFWPLIPTTSLNLAKASFTLGYQDMADTFLQQATTQELGWQKMDAGNFFRTNREAVEAYIQTPRNKQRALSQIETQLTQTPYSWQLLLKKSQLQAELYRNYGVTETLKEVYWLYPTLSPQYAKELTN